MLTEKEVKIVREELLECQNPLFLFHDDPDGLSSYLLFYRFKREGRGHVVKAIPHINERYLDRLRGNDKVFVLDIARMDQDFVDRANVPVIWIDHHTVQEIDRCKYFNSRHKDNANFPTPVMCYQVVEQDLWIATVGTIGDWHLPSFAKDFTKEFPELLPESITRVEDALFSTEVGKLVKVFSFNLKGPTKEVRLSIEAFTKIKSPYEILNKESPEGRLVMEKYEKVNVEYEKLLKRALDCLSDDPILLFRYDSDELSLTKDLANEVLYNNPDKVIVLGRESNGEMKCSIRSGPTIELPDALERALIGVEGYGGGHEHACGCAVKTEDFEKFLGNLKKELNL